MPNGRPAQLANLKPAWPKGHKPNTTRRSKDVDRAIRLARKGAPAAMLYVLEVLNDLGETTRWRLKAAETVLAIALPKDPATLERMLAEMTGGGVTEFRITFVDPLEHAPLVVEHELRQPGGNGHDPEPLEPVFVDPDPQGAE